MLLVGKCGVDLNVGKNERKIDKYDSGARSLVITSARVDLLGRITLVEGRV